MSLDIEVVTSQKPDTSIINEFFSGKKNYLVEGKFESNSNIIVSRQLKSGIQPGFTVDGPFSVEVDDLDNECLATVLSPRWLVQLSVPAAGTKQDLPTANALARQIAQSSDGVVFDPQGGRIIWPKGKKRRYTSKSKEERIRLVTFEWFIPWKSVEDSNSKGKLLLEVFRRFLPEAVPKRFGTYEPLQGRLEDDDTPFLKMW